MHSPFNVVQGEAQLSTGMTIRETAPNSFTVVAPAAHENNILRGLSCNISLGKLGGFSQRYSVATQTELQHCTAHTLIHLLLPTPEQRILGTWGIVVENPKRIVLALDKRK